MVTSPHVPSSQTLAKLATAESHPRWDDKKRVRENVLRVLHETFPRVRFSALWTQSPRYGTSLKIKWPTLNERPAAEEVQNAIACFEVSTGLVVRPAVMPNENGLDAVAFRHRFGSMPLASLDARPMTAADREALLEQELPPAPTVSRPRF